ncbi:MAG: hypothetical protein JWO58_1922 [Chitinophagaceae bacterium]|nr:hypothetical protein [Chitinophagaceae bacterium]
MCRSMTRCLLLISIGLTFSCGRKLVLPSDTLVQREQSKEVLVKFIQVERDSLQTYETAVSAYGKYFSGATYFKNTKDTALRVLFTTYTGLKLLDLELSEKGCSTIYSVEQLNNPIVLKLLCHDFGLIAGIKKEVDVTKVYNDKEGENEVLMLKGEKDLYYYTTPAHAMIKVVETVPGKTKIQTEAYRDVDSSLVVKHRNFNFKLTLKKLIVD